MINNKFRQPESYQENTKQTLILVDYSNLLYRAWFVSSKRIWVACAKFLDMLRLCVRRSKQSGVPIKVIFAGESKVKLDRENIFKEYKGTRGTIEDPKFKRFRVELPELLKFVGWDIICVDGAEADDVIASIVARNCHRHDDKVPCDDFCDAIYDTDIVIFSGDRDLQQCLAWERTFIYRAPGLFMTKALCEEEYGVPVEKYAVYKALTGDRSDNIKGVEGFGPVKASMAVSQQTVAHDIWEMSGQKGKDEFELALQLVNLDTKLNIDLDSLYLGSPIIDEDAVLKKYDAKVLLELNRLKEEF